MTDERKLKVEIRNERGEVVRVETLDDPRVKYCEFRNELLPANLRAVIAE